MRRLALGALAATLAAATTTTALGAGTPAPTAVLDPALLSAGSGALRAFVQYDDAVTAADVTALKAVGITNLHTFDLVPAVAVVAPLADLREALALPGVVRVQKDHGLELNLYESKQAIRADEVRKPVAEKGLGLTGKGVRIAVLDSGVDSKHPDLADRVVASYNFEGSIIGDSYQDGHLSDEYAETTAPFATHDEVGHGTHVASTIAGTGAGSISGRDLSGVAPGAEIVAYKIASAAQGVVYDFGWEANAMAAIEHLIEHNDELGVRIVQNSWGIFEVDNPDSEPIIQMVRAGVASGLTFVFSAGNNGDGPNTVGWPGAMGNVITVAATEKTKAENAKDYAIADFSSRGYQVDIAAPGVDILAARSVGAAIDFGLSAPYAGEDMPLYMGISGTSMSSPHISGVAALLLEANPKLTSQELEEIIERTAVEQGAAGKDHLYGYGMADSYRAAQVANCFETLRKAKDREACFTAVGGLSAKQWESDWDDKGNLSPTSQGSELPI